MSEERRRLAASPRDPPHSLLVTHYSSLITGISMRAAWTALTDAQLLAQCEVDTYRASGPGGQKRNKTSSAVRLRHEESGLSVIAEESRSQHENKAKAVRRLRQAFFLKIREVLADGQRAAIRLRAELVEAK